MSAPLDLEWRPAARADLVAIIDFIGDDCPDAARALADAILQRATKLQAHPRAYRMGRVNGTREMLVRPNYLLVYAISETTVTILRVLHPAQMWP